MRISKTGHSRSFEGRGQAFLKCPDNDPLADTRGRRCQGFGGRFKCLMATLFEKIRNLLPSASSASATESTQPGTETPELSPLSDFLSYYSKVEAPGYAVLVTGAWGVGKTHQVKDTIPEGERYYVSLYGLDSVAAINDAVLAECLPLSKSGGQLAATIGDVGKAMGDKFAVAGFASSIWTAVLKSKLSPDRTLIFDDLERSTLWTSGDKAALLGAINQYVEHGKFRVIVICHDEKVADELAGLKEKTFGHTVKAEPQTEHALTRFINESPTEDTKSFLELYRPLIGEIWAQSKHSSLRILRHVVSDIGRLHSLLEQRHKDNTDAIEHLLRLFVALDIEVRAGDVTAPLLEGRQSKYYYEIASRKKGDASPISDLVEKYPRSDLTGTSSMLSDELLEEMLIKGRYDKSKLSDWLDQTPYFADEEESPPWKIVIGFDTVDDNVLNKGIERMSAQFQGRVISEMGEFLHVAALRLMMAERGELPHDLTTEEENCHQYIDDLVAAERMPPKRLEYIPGGERLDSYDQHMFWGVNRSPELKRIIEHWQSAASAVLVQQMPDYGQTVLEMLSANPKDVFRTISRTNYHYSPLSHTPFMQNIDPTAFVAAWLSGPRSTWRDITLALDNRYDAGAIDNELAPEKAWVSQLSDALGQRIGVAEGLAKYRLQRLEPKIFHQLRQENPSKEPEIPAQQ